MARPGRNAARDIGVTFEDYYPYTPGDQACAGLNGDWPNRLAKITGWQYLNGNPGAMKEYIATYGADHGLPRRLPGLLQLRHRRLPAT